MDRSDNIDALKEASPAHLVETTYRSRPKQTKLVTEWHSSEKNMKSIYIDNQKRKNGKICAQNIELPEKHLYIIAQGSLFKSSALPFFLQVSVRRARESALIVHTKIFATMRRTMNDPHRIATTLSVKADRAPHRVQFYIAFPNDDLATRKCHFLVVYSIAQQW